MNDLKNTIYKSKCTYIRQSASKMKHKPRNFVLIVSKTSTDDEEESLRAFFLVSNQKYTTMTWRQKDDRERRWCYAK